MVPLLACMPECRCLACDRSASADWLILQALGVVYAHPGGWRRAALRNLRLLAHTAVAGPARTGQVLLAAAAPVRLALPTQAIV